MHLDLFSYSLLMFDFINSVSSSIFIMISQLVIFVIENFFYPQFCGYQTELDWFSGSQINI